MFDPSVWPKARWNDYLPGGPVTFGVDVAVDRSAAWIVAMAGGVAEVVEARPAVSWVPSRLVELSEKWQPFAVGIDGTGPAATIADQLIGTDVAARLVVLSGRQMTMASGEAYDSIVEGRLRARLHEDLDRAVLAVQRRSVGQAWTFARQVGDVSCSPLIAMTAALWATEHAPEPVEVSQIW